MKFFHLSDLHIGKRVNEFSMLEDQAFVLSQILDMIDREKPDGVLIAGDVYDKSVPGAEAVSLFDDFLVRLAHRKVQVFIISGNHDSAERLAFGGRLMDAEGVHISPVFDGRVASEVLTDEFGEAEIFLLPFLKPATVRRAFPDREIESYDDAVRAVVESIGLKADRRNVILSHQFVTGASRSESEEVSVGGSDNIDGSIFDPFDYVALGHIHGPQRVGRDAVRYCGTPLKYSFSEVSHQKSVTVAELGAKGSLTIRTLPLTPLHEMRELRGSYEELTLKENREKIDKYDYVRIILTDEEDVPDAVGKLRVIYPNLMKLEYDNLRTRGGGSVGVAEDVESKSQLELFAEFYEKQNNQPMSEEQTRFVSELIEKIWGDEK